MKFRFRNIGPIENAELELGDLTIIAGRNNTGKTSLVYTLYGFLKGFRGLLFSSTGSRFFESHFKELVSLSTDEIVSKLFADGQAEWEADKDFLLKEQARLIKELTLEFSEHGISRVFSTSQVQFEDSSLELEFGSEIPANLHLDFPIRKGRDLSIAYNGTKFTVLLTSSEPLEDSRIEPLVTLRLFKIMYSRFLLNNLFALEYRPFILSSARHSIPLFTKELDYVRSQVVRLLQQQEDEQDDEPIVGLGPLSNTSRYSLPIHDNINFSRSISGRAERNDNKPPSVFPDDLEKMMGGYFKSINGDLRFISSAENRLDFDIPLHLASSSSWEMSNLYFFLGYFMDSENSHFLIIDEPESHLDTANQIQLARLLTRLVNSGVKVLITTHSDYIIREINNLIMLSSPLQDGDKARTALGYKPDEQLSLDRVQAYVAREGELSPCDKSKFGVSYSVFDDTIDSLNETTEELATQIILRARGK